MSKILEPCGPAEPEAKIYFGEGATETLSTMQEQFHQSRQLRRIRKGLHVLIVEDQAFSRRLLQEFFWRICTVDAAASSNEAMPMYLGNAPNLAFLDIDLPDENGHKLAELIKRLDPDAFVVMVTANHTSEDVGRAMANQIDGYIVKTFSKLKIMNCVDKYKAKHVPQNSLRGKSS
jgi:two-component system, chemotaxis family, chemotaxis protein CheY